MDKILEALKKLLPEDQVNEVATAINSMLESHKTEMETEYNAKLEEAYADLTDQLTQAEKVGEEGYDEAYSIIKDLKARLETQGEEYNEALKEGYAEAAKLIEEEKAKSEKLELEMYEEYEAKLNEMKNYMVDRIDEYLTSETHKIYEHARRELMNDPRISEHKVALDKIVEVASTYLSNDHFDAANQDKVDGLVKELENMKTQLKLTEARSIRLASENTKINEAYRKSQEMITESQKSAESNKVLSEQKEKNERAEKAKNVTGKGAVVANDNQIVLETTDADANDEYKAYKVLAGLSK